MTWKQPWAGPVVIVPVVGMAVFAPWWLSVGWLLMAAAAARRSK